MSLGEYNGAGSGTTKLLLHLNGNSNDSSGNSNNGTDTAITYSQANGKFGQGAGFNPATSSYISIANNASLSGTGSHTLSCFVKFNSLPTSGNNMWILAKGKDYSTNGWGLLLQVLNTSGTINFNAIMTNGTNIYTSAGTVPSTNTWYHISAVYNSSLNTIILYVNGSPQGTPVSTTGTMRYANGGIVGAYRATNGSVVAVTDGSIDEVIIENRAWSANEVKKYYTMTKGRFGII